MTQNELSMDEIGCEITVIWFLKCIAEGYGSFNGCVEFHHLGDEYRKVTKTNK